MVGTQDYVRDRKGNSASCSEWVVSNGRKTFGNSLYLLTSTQA